ncbi:MAG TPA: hypothetical protein VEM15_13090 [Thermodesulfobacteriota bacterium]|nr:hypothetical protein [Thermodesulfobacteriota bacterium]
MEGKFSPEKYGMVVCPVCDGYGRMHSPDDVDVKVCQNCGGFGFIKKEGKRFDRKGNPVLITASGGQ